MKGFFKVIRPINLLIIAITMFAMRYLVISPLMNGLDGITSETPKLQLSVSNFCLLVFSVLCIAAAGNIINDYFDEHTDRINKPKKVIVGRLMKRRVAMVIHFSLNSLSILIGIYLCWKVGVYKLIFIHLFATASLWYYSTIFKKEFLIGNIIIALISALVPITVGLFELPLLVKAYGVELSQYYQNNGFKIDESDVMAQQFFTYTLYWMSVFSIFAFITTLIREIVKDIEDMKGDRKIGAMTIPLKWGIKKTNMLLSALYVIFFLSIAYGLNIYLKAFEEFMSQTDWITTIAFVSIVVILPALISWILNIQARRRKDYHTSGNLMKLCMLGGISFSVLIFFMIAKVQGL